MNTFQYDRPNGHIGPSSKVNIIDPTVKEKIQRVINKFSPTTTATKIGLSQALLKDRRDIKRGYCDDCGLPYKSLGVCTDCNSLRTQSI